MYATHQQQIELWANGSPENTHDVLKFVLFTANKRFALVPLFLHRYHTNAGADGLSFRQRNNLTTLWHGRRMVYKAIQTRRHDPVALMQYLVSLDGLSVAKAGFAAQLLTGTVGCFDTWNMRNPAILAMLGVPSLNKSLLRIDRTTTDTTVTKKLTAYVHMCAQLGSAFLWDNWCATLASQYKAGNKLYPWKTAEEVSQFHVDTCIRYA